MMQLKWTGRKHWIAKWGDLLEMTLQYYPSARTLKGQGETWVLRQVVYLGDDRPRWSIVDCYHSLDEAKAASESIANRWHAEVYNQSGAEEWSWELFWDKNSEFWIDVRTSIQQSHEEEE